MTSVEDSSFAAILAPSVAASRRIVSDVIPPPQDPRHGEPAVDRLGCLRQRLVLGQARLDNIRASDVDVFERVAGGFDVGDVDGLDLADVAEDRVQLAGEAVQLAIGQGQPGQTRQVGNVISGDLRHDTQA